MLSIIVPTYNESEIIEQTINDLQKIKNIEIIISDGGSTDDTIQKVNKLKQKYKNIKIIENKIRGRKGGDIEKGIEKSSRNFCIFVDADLSCGISSIKKILKELEKYDVVISYRSFKGRNFLRKFLSKGYILLVKILFRTKIKDPQCGLKGFKRNEIIPILKEIKNKDLFWDTEFIIKTDRKGLKIKEISVPWIEKRKSKINTFKTFLEFFYKLIKLRLSN
jgi:glycosyltransferase involved in cell wall biosynthesis